MLLKKRVFRSIESKLGLIIACVLTFTFVGYMAVNYFSLRSRLRNELAETADFVKARLSSNLILPIWNLDKVQAEEIIRSEMKDKRVFAIIVNDNSGKGVFSGFTRNKDWKILPTKQEISGPYLLKKAVIAKGKEKIGSAKIYLTGKYADQQLRHMLWNMIFTVILLNIVLLVAIILSMKLLVMRPIKHISDGLREGAKQVESASEQISSASESLAEGASEQAGSIEETSSSLEEMSSMTKQNADNAKEANRVMKEEAGPNFQVIGERASKMDTAINESVKASDETAKIIKTIDEIAFQTNLLALNAAVEAARAGEAGAGFAVVADEVRNLAMRAADAARNTAELIDSSNQRIKQASDLNEEVMENLKQNEGIAEKIATLVDEIAAASGEQAEGIEQISKAVAEMDKVVQQNAANAEESASASEEMNAQAAQMKGIVNGLVTLVNGDNNLDRGNGASKKKRLGFQHAAEKGTRPHNQLKRLTVPEATNQFRPDETMETVETGTSIRT